MTDNDKRRLPVLQSNAEAEEEPRPTWHWVGFGVVAIFIVWLPLAYLARNIGETLSKARLGGADIESVSRDVRLAVYARVALPHAVALAIACISGGFLVTRFGQKTKRRDAAFAGLAVGSLALGLAYAEVGFSFGAMIVPLLACLSALAGGALGKALRDTRGGARRR